MSSFDWRHPHRKESVLLPEVKLDTLRCVGIQIKFVNLLPHSDGAASLLSDEDFERTYMCP